MTTHEKELGATPWQIGTPVVKNGTMERFICRIHSKGNFSREFIRPLEYASNYMMPLSDHCTDIPAEAKEVDGEDDLSWTGWFEEFCENCDTQLLCTSDVIAWIRLDDVVTACSELAALRATAEQLARALADEDEGLKVAQRGLDTAESCMSGHELMDSKYDNARLLVYTSKIACHATRKRSQDALTSARELKLLPKSSPTGRHQHMLD
jgi:hypothetical protein